MSTVVPKPRRSDPIRPAGTAAQDVTGKIVRPTTVELVTTEMRRMILSGRLGPGEALRQEALADELGVSRVPIREAISRLCSEGLLNVVPHKGAYVCALSVAEVRETFAIRLRLEPWIFAEAIPRITDAQILTAERLVEEMDQAGEGEWGQRNWSLHETLYEAAERGITVQMLRVLHDRSDRYFRFQVVNVPIRQQAHDEHMQLVDACRRRDPKLGAKLLEQHVKVAAQQIIAIVERW
jgi:DNA-binding GntR family transcriptional regulator